MKIHENQKRQNLKFNPQVLNSTTILQFDESHSVLDRLRVTWLSHLISEISKSRILEKK